MSDATQEVPRDFPDPLYDDYSPLLRVEIIQRLEPVLDVLAELHRWGLVHVLLSGENNLEIIRRELQRMPSPVITIAIDDRNTLTVRVATCRGVPYPEVLTTAKWRCIRTSHGVEVYNQLYDNRDAMALGLITQVVAFASPPVNPQGQPTILLPGLPATPAREQRVIMVDAPEEE